MRLIVISGRSGSGKSTALHQLEDEGFYCIDNLPTDLVMATVDLYENGKIPAESGIALCMDVRDQKFASTFHELKKKLTDRIRVEVIFLTAEIHVIATRYGATRRKHPLLLSGETLTEAIEFERSLVADVRTLGFVFDSSNLPAASLRAWVKDFVSVDASKLMLLLESFGFKHGVPLDADLVFDVRCLANPHYEPALQPPCRPQPGSCVTGSPGAL